MSKKPTTTSFPYRPTASGTQPPALFEPYFSTQKRAPRQPLVRIPQTRSEITGPTVLDDRLGPNSHDLTKQHKGVPLGRKILVKGRVTDDAGRPERHTLLEIWQCNAAGRYQHVVDQQDAPLDPNFTGRGATLTDDNGNYAFITIEPGAYPWKNHYNAWRPKHIHFSLFGPSFLTRLITQMYFPGDPLLEYDPIFNSVPDPLARNRLVSHFAMDAARPAEWLAYRFDIVLRGREQTPMEN